MQPQVIVIPARSEVKNNVSKRQLNVAAYCRVSTDEDEQETSFEAQMEGYSVEDSGEGICFCVFCYNVQLDIIIDYTEGSSRQHTVETTVTAAPRQTETYNTPSTEKQGTTYILNTNTKKFHYPSCSSAEQIKDKNKKEFSGDREDIISQGYSPCKRCNP